MALPSAWSLTGVRSGYFCVPCPSPAFAFASSDTATPSRRCRYEPATARLPEVLLLPSRHVQRSA
jgi:hypothetical protein